MTDSSKTNEFLRLLMANQKRIYAFILSLVPNHEDAEDLFQQTVLIMWSRFDTFVPGTSFATWGITIAKYQVLSVRKRYARDALHLSNLAIELLEQDCQPFIEHIDSRMHALRRCMSRLASRDCELIRLRYEQEMTIKAIAQQAGRSVQSIYKRMARIHDALLRCIRAALAKEGLA
ncbi:MAG: sigma-70 family RNA polymerase sigma factor [Sedimentisphaerales bacterium]|nr:sigma-70 family RNA polymerase sigma factor [Sedimentisphaerales bacterium]